MELTVLCDFVHVLEYIWKAAWRFFDEGYPAAEAWVKEKATEVPRSKAPVVAGAIRCKATCLGLSRSRRANADACADYLVAKSKYLDYVSARRKRVANRHRDHRRRGSLLGRRPARRDWDPLGSEGRRGRLEAPRHSLKR